MQWIIINLKQSDDSGPARKKSTLKNPLTPEQQQQALQHMQQPVDPIVIQPTQHSAPAIIPHLQSIYGEELSVYLTEWNKKNVVLRKSAFELLQTSTMVIKISTPAWKNTQRPSPCTLDMSIRKNKSRIKMALKAHGSTLFACAATFNVSNANFKAARSFLFSKNLFTDNTPSWQPKYWSVICPYPLCPSYRQFARLVSIVLIGE